MSTCTTKYDFLCRSLNNTLQALEHSFVFIFYRIVYLFRHQFLFFSQILSLLKITFYQTRIFLYGAAEYLLILCYDIILNCG